MGAEVSARILASTTRTEKDAGKTWDKSWCIQLWKCNSLYKYSTLQRSLFKALDFRHFIQFTKFHFVHNCQNFPLLCRVDSQDVGLIWNSLKHGLAVPLSLQGSSYSSFTAQQKRMSGSNGGGMFVVENYGWLKILVKMCLCLSSLKSQEIK